MRVIGPSTACALESLCGQRFDVVVVGGGIQGAMVHLEAARHGLNSVLVERNDFGAATSANSLRIVHGGLRYLQRLDVRRSLESSAEQQWFLEHMAPLVEPLPCLLPLYNRGLKRRSTMRIALALNRSIATLAGGSAAEHGPNGGLLDTAETRACFPGVPQSGLVGAARWFDLKLLSPSRLIIETLKGAAALGGYALNYVEAVGLECTGRDLRAVTVVDRRDGRPYTLAARVVINAAGPALRAVAGRWDADVPALFYPAVAWNLLLARPPLSAHAVALQDPARERPLLFATSLEGRLLVGTGHAALPGAQTRGWRAVVERELPSFLAAINRAVPGLALERGEVSHVYAGLMPARGPGMAEPSSRAVIYDHGAHAGPRGLYSVSGVKLTTARTTARRVLKRLLGSGRLTGARADAHDYPRLDVAAKAALFGPTPSLDDASQRAELERIIDEEAVEHLDDLVLRRTNLGDQPEHALAVASAFCTLDPRWQRQREQELARLLRGLELGPAPCEPSTAAGRLRSTGT